jgi:ammonia channel protein AmtB
VHCIYLLCVLRPASFSINFILQILSRLLLNQIKACVLTIVLSVVATTIIALIVKYTIGLRPTQEVEDAGLDTSEHGEEGYLID